MAIKETLTQSFGPDYQSFEVGNIAILAQNNPLKLDCGKEISHFPIAYQTYGTLNADKSNAIMICHGLTADQYAASPHPITGKLGWWDFMIGSGKPIDTDEYFVICSNVLGGCMGSYGPRSLDDSGDPIGLNFPVITIADMVRAQALLVASLGITKLCSVIGGSMGGMQALAWAALYPQRLGSIIAIACGGTLSPQNIAFNEIGRQAITVDEGFQNGNYHQSKSFPAKGLAVARMAAHITYMSESGLQQKFGRDLQDREKLAYGFEADFQIESYLHHQGASFVKRFDPNSYFYITRAMDYFDIAELMQTAKNSPFADCANIPFLLLSFSTDWLFTTSQMRHLVRMLNAANVPVSFAEIETQKGHDGFLLPNEIYENAVSGFLK